MNRLCVPLVELPGLRSFFAEFRVEVKRYTMYLEAMQRIQGERQENTTSSSSSVKGQDRPWLRGGEMVEIVYPSGKKELGRLYIKGDWALVDSEKWGVAARLFMASDLPQDSTTLDLRTVESIRIVHSKGNEEWLRSFR